jgi:uncharacterized protein (DUF302 family)
MSKRDLLRLFLSVITLCFPFFGAAASDVALKNPAAWVYSVTGNFKDVKEDLVRAIEAQGAVVSYAAHASAMLDRTAVTLGVKEKVYLDAEVILFCKAEIAHELVQARPHSLVLCPYPVAIYTLAADPQTVYLSIRKPPQGMPEYQAVQDFLLTIIDETTEF